MGSMDSFRTCTVCGRSLFKSDADEQGRCCHCQGSTPLQRQPPGSLQKPVSTPEPVSRERHPTDGSAAPESTRQGRRGRRDGVRGASSTPDVATVSRNRTREDE